MPGPGLRPPFPTPHTKQYILDRNTVMNQPLNKVIHHTTSLIHHTTPNHATQSNHTSQSIIRHH